MAESVKMSSLCIWDINKADPLILHDVNKTLKKFYKQNKSKMADMPEWVSGVLSGLSLSKSRIEAGTKDILDHEGEWYLFIFRYER